MQQGFTYPPMPKGVDDSVLKPSPAFKSEVFKVAGAILFFVISYIVLVTAACGLAVLCGFAGIGVIILKPMVITILLGAGIAGMGLMVVFFMLKFIFSRHKTDRSGLLEVTETDQPELFSFIHKLTSETQTPFPKKIYLSADVNACVFYDSGFWSMFLPVRKNLQIGLGLVNSVNISEFKAIMAHEFGHFSQRSMKLGSYVYNVNKIIYNMLYDNAGYGKMLSSWAGVSDYFAFFARLTIGIIGGIQWVLQKVYSVVNLRYMSLSRQMEFHADAVAAYVTGANHLVTSLRRLEAADICYNRLISYYNQWLAQNLRPENMYSHHTTVMKHFAEDFNIPYENGLPQVTGASQAFFNSSKLVIKDQWASHPSTDDREQHLNELNIVTEAIHESAWCIFRNAENLQKQMTQKLYEEVKFEQTPVILTHEAFCEKYFKEIEENNFNKIYKGFYDFRDLTEFDPEMLAATENVKQQLAFEDVFEDTACALPSAINGLNSDIAIIGQIMRGELAVKTFDYEGRRYKADDAHTVNKELQNALENAREKLAALDKKAFGFFYSKAMQKAAADVLVQAYKKLFTVTSEADADIALYNEMREKIAPIYSGAEMTIDDANAMVSIIKVKELDLKMRIDKILADDNCKPYLTAEQVSALQKYTSANLPYFNINSFDNDSLNILNEAVFIFGTLAYERKFKTRKEVLDMQLTYL